MFREEVKHFENNTFLNTKEFTATNIRKPEDDAECIFWTCTYLQIHDTQKYNGRANFIFFSYSYRS
jgi:hypothetical protein